MAERIEQLEITASIRRGLADVAAGRTRPARQAIESLATELGLKLGDIRRDHPVAWAPPPMDG
jgi:hypothetical protein